MPGGGGVAIGTTQHFFFSWIKCFVVLFTMGWHWPDPDQTLKEKTIIRILSSIISGSDTKRVIRYGSNVFFVSSNRIRIWPKYPDPLLLWPLCSRDYIVASRRFIFQFKFWFLSIWKMCVRNKTFNVFCLLCNFFCIGILKMCSH